MKRAEIMIIVSGLFGLIKWLRWNKKGLRQAGSWMWAEMRRSMRRKTNSTP